MGIKDLNKFLRSKCPQVYKEVHLSNLQFKKCAVDISLYIFKYVTIFGEDGWIAAFLNLVSCLRRNNIHACFIYDTKAPEEKNEERKDRREKRDKLDERIAQLCIALDKAKMTNEFDPILLDLIKDSENSVGRKRLLGPNPGKIRIDIDEIERQVERVKKQSVKLSSVEFDLTKSIFQILGVPHFNAPGEAETTCAHLCKKGEVDFVLSEDTDVLAYGAPFFLTKINTSSDTCVLISYDEVLSALDFSREEFLDLCIMFGTDYNKNIFKIGPEKAFKLLNEHRTIEKVAESGIDVSPLKHVRVRELFQEYEQFNEHIPYCKPADYNKLSEFMFKHNIRFNIEKLKRDLAPPELSFED